MCARLLAASLLLLAAACGEIRTVSSDAGSDGGPDATPEVGTLSLVLRGPFEGTDPLPGSTMLVVMPDGTVIGEDVTDDEGLASVDGVPQGAIMLVFLDVGTGAEGYFNFAFYDVGPGDEIVFGREDGDQGEPLGTMDIQLPAFKDPAPTYHASNGCQENTPNNPDTPTTVTLSFYESCVSEDSANVLAWVVGESGDILGYIDANEPFVASTPMDLTTHSWQSPDTLDVALDGIPAEVNSVSFQTQQMLGRLEFGPFVDQVGIETPATDLELASAVPPGFGDSTLVQVAFGANQPTLGEQLLVHRTGDDVAWDLSGELLPWYSSGVYSVEDRRMTWSRTSGREPDAHYILLTWTEEGSGSMNAWYTVSPPDRDELVLPPLPAEWEERHPIAPAASSVDVYAPELSSVDGYAAARVKGFNMLGEDMLASEAEGSTWRLSLGAGAEF